MDIRAEQLFGTWKLISAEAVDAAGGALRPPYGPRPMGRLVLTPEGRMMAVLCDGREGIPAGEIRAYSSYCGNYRVDGGRLVTTVDAAALPGRIGSKEVRQLTLRTDGTLVLSPPRRADGEQRQLVWERCGPA